MTSSSHSPYRDLDDGSSYPHIQPSNTSTPSSSVRPRNRRVLPSSNELTTSSTDVGFGNASVRTASPIPPKHPSRIANRTDGTHGAGVGRPVGGLVDAELGVGHGTGRKSPNIGFGRGLWGGSWTGSWTAVQGLANSYLGGETNGTNAYSGSDNRARVSENAAAKKAPATWGPSGIRQRENTSGGFLAEQSAALTARKTVSILESGGGANGGLDISGNYKRRTSMEVPLSPGIEEEALCYVHIVLPTDTQSGVILKYQCRDAAAFRKANRLYPNDPLQLRKTVLLPVETCTIKGRPCEGPSDTLGIDLLAPTPTFEDGPSSLSYSNGVATDSSSQQQANPFAPSPVPPKDDSANESWTHVRWVLLFSSPSSQPTEIVRLPRKTLGFFPPRRRKSNPRLSSSFSTPRTSIDLLPNESPSHALSHNPSGSTNPSNLAASSIGSYFPPSSTLAPTSRSRTDSLSSLTSTKSSNTATNPSSDQRLPSFMRRPGGVGTMKRNVRAPGPAQDGFNAWATRQFPNLTIDHLPSTSTSSASGAGAGGLRVAGIGFGFKEELGSIDEIGANGVGMGAVGAEGEAIAGGGGGLGLGFGFGMPNIEGWVRKAISRTHSSVGTPKVRPETGGAGGLFGDGMLDGDLIELLDGTGSDDGRGFEVANNANARPPESGNGSTMLATAGLLGGVRERGGKGKHD